MKLFLFEKTENKVIRTIKNIVVYSFILSCICMLLMVALPSLKTLLNIFITIGSILFCVGSCILVVYGVTWFVKELWNELKNDRKMNKYKKQQEILEKASQTATILFESLTDYYDENHMYHYVKCEYFLTPDGEIIIKNTSGGDDSYRCWKSENFSQITFEEFNDRISKYNVEDSKKYLGISKDNYNTYIQNDKKRIPTIEDTEYHGSAWHEEQKVEKLAKPWVRIAEAYDGGFTEFYCDLINEHSSLKMRETSFHYNANKETLLSEVPVPSTLTTLEDILQFIYENVPKTYKVDMNYLNSNVQLTDWIISYLCSLAKHEESTRSAAIENRKDTTDKLVYLSRKINNFYYNCKFYILTDVIKIELSWEDYGTGNRLGWVHKSFEIRFDEKNYKYVEDICKVILQAVKDNMPYDIITDEEYSIELSSLITSFKKKYADSFPFLNKDGLTMIKTLKNTIKKSDSPNAFDWECDTELVELACDRNNNFYIVITVENTTAENNGRPSTRRNVKKFDTNITFTNFSDVTYVNYIDYITCEFITSLYSKKAPPYDSKDIKLYKKYDEDIYFVRLYSTAYNTGGTLYFDLEKDYFVNHSIEDFCDFIQEKCIWNEDYFSDYREVIKQNHTVLQLFKKDNVSYTEEIPKLYHWTSSSKSEMLLIEIYCDTGGGEGVVIDSSSNTPYHKWWDMGNMWGNRSLEMTWEQVENVDPIKFKGINEHNWKKYIK